jgi:predicted alpha-1,2-mannosidase
MLSGMVKGIVLFAVTLSVLPAISAGAQDRPPTSYVDPFVGTGGHGHTYPGPSLPFGMIQPGPDTRLSGWDGCSGYHYSDSRIFGFSHTHLSGTGIPDYADILVMPMSGEPRLNNGADGRPGYSSAFSHDDEIARPGYYAVTLRDHGVRVELTTTLRAALHRYAFPQGRPAHVILDLEHRDRLLGADIEVVNEREIAGFRRSSSWARDQVVYFVMRFSKPFTIGRDEAAEAKRALSFGVNAGTVLVKVGISAVSVEGARRNLDAEIAGWDFEQVRRAADAAWERELAKIRVRGGSVSQRTTFYTALYHVMLTPNVYMDVDGQYRGRDLQVHRAEGFTYYSVFSLWDTFRALHPLLTLIDRARTRDFIQTLLRQYQEGGRLPVWELAANETDTMIGYHAVPVIADAVAKGINGFDLDLAFEALKHSADEDRFGLAAYRRNGFIDASDEAEGVSRTLEYAFDDWAIAQVARRLGRRGDYDRYLRRAQSWKHLFDPSTGFMRARVEGFWMTPFDPAEVNNHYTEANAWQYSFFVPHDVDGLMRFMGGERAFARKLDTLFSTGSRTTGRQQADITGLIGQYAHGNEPSHHMAYLYSFAGEPWRTQAMVRRILGEMYQPRPDGLSGNEDCGQMSAWYVFSALGFYPVVPGAPEYVLGSPLFDEATINLENGREFSIRRSGPDFGPYIARASLNGKDYTRTGLDHDAILAGGDFEFVASATPVMSRGVAGDARPRSGINERTVVAAPFILEGQRLFRGVQQITLGTAERDVEVHHTTDGADPTRESPRYAGPIAVGESTTVKAIAFRGGAASPIVSFAFRQLSDFPRITLSAPYAPQYAAAGDDTLIDGLRGNESFKTGRWQGYRAADLDVTLDFGEARDVHHVSMGFLQDMGSWILMPRRIIVEASEDGRSYAELGRVDNVVPEQESRPMTRDFALELSRPARTRYLRVHVVPYGPLPAWHPGAGEPAWFFADEVVVR